MKPRRATAGSGLFYSLSLGITTVAVPLLASARGFTLGQIGTFVAVSAISQIILRSFLPGVMRTIGEPRTIALGCGCLAFGSLWFSLRDSTLAFLGSQVIFGASRAMFWTASQTQSVRHETEAGLRMAELNTATGTGQLAGPALAGIIGAQSLTAPLYVAALLALTGVVPTLGLHAHPRARRPAEASTRGLWRNRGVLMGSWAALTAGSWRAMLTSYVPAVLQGAGMGTLQIGLLLSGANGAGVVASAASVPITRRWSSVRTLLVGTVVTGLGVGLIGVTAGVPIAVGAALVISGLGAGAVQTVGPGLTAASLEPWQKGNGIALAGLFRAGSLFATPLAVAGAMVVVPFSAAAAFVGVALAAPVVVVGRLGRARPGAPRPAPHDST